MHYIYSVAVYVTILFVLLGCDASNGKQDNQTETVNDNVEIIPQKTEYDEYYHEEEASANTETQQTEAWINEYNITVEINPDDRTVTGVEKLIYKNLTGQPLNTLYFNVYLNAFNRGANITPYFDSFKSRIFQNNGGVVDYAYMNIANVTAQNEELEINLESTVLEVKLTEALNAEEVIEISITFDSYIPIMNHRTGANEYAMWFGNFFPVLSVYDENGWNTASYYPAGDPFYSNVSNYNVTVITPQGYTVVATGSEEASNEAENLKTTVKAIMVRDFAFAVSNKYKVKSVKTPSNKYINFYAYSDFDNIDLILETAVSSMEYFSNKIGSYPDSSFDIIETGLFFSGGMEYPLVMFIDSQYLETPPPYTTIAHEIGHQWFYGVVGSNQIKSAWLDEGLISYIQQSIFYSDEQIANIMYNDYNNLVEQLAQLSNVSLHDGLEVYESWRDYSVIHYKRAKLMFYSLSLKLGKDKFDELLKNYYTRFSYKIARASDFISLSEEIYGESLAVFFDGWMDGNTLPPFE